MMLENKVAIVYGGAGAIGTAVSTAFAREGAVVHLVGRRLSGSTRSPARSVRRVVGPRRPASTRSTASRRCSCGRGRRAVGSARHHVQLDRRPRCAGHPAGGDVVERLRAARRHRPPLDVPDRTGRWARHMIPQGSGVILTFGGDGGRNPIRDYSIGGFVVALDAGRCPARQHRPSSASTGSARHPAHRRRARDGARGPPRARHDRRADHRAHHAQAHRHPRRGRQRRRLRGLGPGRPDHRFRETTSPPVPLPTEAPDRTQRPGGRTAQRGSLHIDQTTGHVGVGRNSSRTVNPNRS